MASQPISQTQQQESDFELLPSLLSAGFDAISGTFRNFLDHELGLGEVALANEAQAHQLAINANEAPVGSTGSGLFGSDPAQQFTTTTLLLVAGLGLVILILLRS